MELPEDWGRLVSAQDGLVTRRQALARGLTAGDITAHLDAGRWQLAAHGVIATFTGPLPIAARRRVALLFVPGPAALSHDSAGVLWNLLRVEEGRIHTTVPYGSSARGCAAVDVHRSRAFEHIVVDADPPRVNKPQTIVDLATAEPDARSALRRFTALAAGARVSAAALEAAIELRRPRRYRRALRDAVAMLRDGVSSVLEADWALDVESAHGLPTPTRQFPVVVDGVRRAEDLLFTPPGGEFLIRLDGWRYHADRRTARVDRARDNAAELAHRARMVFGWEEVHHEPCATAAMVGRRLLELGWPGPLRPCSRCPPGS